MDLKRRRTGSISLFIIKTLGYGAPKSSPGQPSAVIGQPGSPQGSDVELWLWEMPLPHLG